VCLIHCIFVCYSIFSFIYMFCRSLFVLLYFFFRPLCRLFYFYIRILITPLVSSKCSCSFSCVHSVVCPSIFGFFKLFILHHSGIFFK
jgi:hypothetical protein